jgi:glycosyltransferase involved in cell wall biosynthesis
MQAPLERLRLLSEGLLQYLTPGHCMNPLLGPQWLKQADGVTVITPALREFVADDIPTHVLRPGVAFDEFHPDEPSSSLRDAVSLEKEERLVFYPGGVNRLNRGDLLDLYRAIQMINDKGILCRLIQCGPHTRAFLHQVDPRLSRHVTVLGYIDRSYIPRWLATADVLIQPGHDDRFNRYRLPSKIPQFLATGVPSILPRTNIGLELEDHREALLLKSGEPDEIAEQCLRVFDRDPALAGMREASVSFAQRHFDLARNTEKLLGFYRQVLSASRTPKTPVAEPRRVSRWLDPWWYRYLCYRLQRKPGR